MTVPLLYLKTRHLHRLGRAGPLPQRRQDVSGRAQENKVRFADLHVVICEVKARVSRARSVERANQQFQDVLRATVCLSASVPALGRTRHPFAVSGSEEPSPKIEFSLRENIRSSGTARMMKGDL